MSLNGFDSDAPLTERMIGTLASLRHVLDGCLKSLDSLSEQQDSGFESVRKETRDEVGKVRDDLDELRELLVKVQVVLGIVREDQTNPKGVRLLNPAEVPLQEKDDGTGFEITAEQVRLPNAWAFAVLKFGVSAGGGALFLRLVQWAATGH